MNLSTTSPEVLWNDFIASFKSNLEYFHEQIPLHQTLKSKPAMTAFYKNELFQKVAESLNLQLTKKEFLRVDMMMYQPGQFNYEVPSIAIESENNQADEIANEIRKLLNLNAPLKVLITRESINKQLMDEDTHWQYVIDDFVQFNRMVGWFAVISAVWVDDQLQYEYIVYRENGEKYCDLCRIYLN